ncbi:DUF6291 domain-containing protein [Lutibacter sp.]|uniref:DUF6291 domain-containing protein n=1 Tax=Lutibacter sp. TaxID=1925666 RepID=UPI00349FD9F4
MAEGKKSFIAYSDWNGMFKALPDEVAGKLIKHIFAYVNDENPETDDYVINALFENVKCSLKRDLKKWDKQREQRSQAGKASAKVRATKSNDRSTSVNEKVRKATVSDSVSVSVSVDTINSIYSKFVDEVKSGGFATRIEAIYMRLRIREGSLTDLLKNYKLHIIEENRLHKNTNDFFTNFKNWLNVQDRIGNLNKYKK